MVIERFEVGPMGNNVYLVVDEESGDAAIIDPGLESDPALDRARERGWKVRAIINTHGHFDHVDRDAHFRQQTGAELLIHADDAPMLRALPQQAAWFGMSAGPAPAPDRLLRDGDEISVGRIRLRVLHTPGHTPGGVCLLTEPAESSPVLFSGDTLFAGSVGRTDFVGGDYATLIRSIRERLLPLPDDTLVYPGHGPETTIGEERRSNPFVGGE
ncbi:MAG: MBL fold metallo-hydrolase [Armatimonadetes bacterium]|nr:MBL fold metallo-hydrolase [Armatimonadota bacterium]